MDLPRKAVALLHLCGVGALLGIDAQLLVGLLQLLVQVQDLLFLAGLLADEQHHVQDEEYHFQRRQALDHQLQDAAGVQAVKSQVLLQRHGMEDAGGGVHVAEKVHHDHGAQKALLPERARVVHHIHDRKQSDLVAVLLEDQRRGTVQHALQ